MNDHEVHAECLKLLRDGLPAPAPSGAEDGREFLPLGIDVDGDIAVVTFLRTPHNAPPAHLPFIEGWTFHRRDGEWRELGGGGGAAPPEPLSRFSAEELGGHLQRYGSGRTVRNSNRVLPWGAKFVSQARLRASREVDSLQVGARTLPVPDHGHVVVVWGARRPPLIQALSARGDVLDTLDLDQALARA